jgi:hypothetical protein
MMPDPDLGRRREDTVLAHVQTEVALVKSEVALVKQGVELGAKASDARFDGIAKSIDTLSIKLDRVIDGQTEPGASPAGRALLEKVDANTTAIALHDGRLDGVEAFQTTVLATFRTFRLQFAAFGTLIALIVGYTAIVTFLNGAPK